MTPAFKQTLPLHTNTSMRVSTRWHLLGTNQDYILALLHVWTALSLKALAPPPCIWCGCVATLWFSQEVNCSWASAAQPYWSMRHELVVHNGLLFKQNHCYSNHPILASSKPLVQTSPGGNLIKILVRFLIRFLLRSYLYS